MKSKRVSYQISKGGEGSHGRARIMDDVIRGCTTSSPSALKRDDYRRTREV